MAVTFSQCGRFEMSTSVCWTWSTSTCWCQRLASHCVATTVRCAWQVCRPTMWCFLAVRNLPARVGRARMAHLYYTLYRYLCLSICCEWNVVSSKWGLLSIVTDCNYKCNLSWWWTIKLFCCRLLLLVSNKLIQLQFMSVIGCCRTAQQIALCSNRCQVGSVLLLLLFPVWLLW